MAPLPKRRHSTRRGGKRVAATKLSIKQLKKCPSCGKLISSHMVCSFCGTYKGVLVKKQKPETKKKSSK